MQEKLWFNSNIRRDNKILYIPQLFNQNLIFVKDIMDKDQFLKYQQFKDKFNCNVTFVDYYGIIRAIKTGLNITTPPNNTPVNLMKLDRINSSNHVSKLIYNDMNKGKYPQKSYEKIQQMLQIEITEDEFLSYFPLIYKSNKFTKIQEFQYEILNTAVVTNTRLKNGVY